MSIGIISHIMKTRRPKPFFMSGNVKNCTIQNNHSTRQTKYTQVSVDEIILGDKKRVLITKRDSSQSPIITTVTTKEKQFENGKLTFSEVKKRYEYEPLVGDIRDLVGWEKIRKNDLKF